MYNNQLDTFIEVVKSGSFSKAAQNLYISPTAVIKQINLLESSLDLHLFERTHRGLIITEAGKSLFQDAKYIIQYSKDSLVRARNSMNSSDNVICIGTSIMTPSQFLISLWPKIHEINSNLKFQLIPFENTPENAREILKNLGSNIDIVAGLYDGVFLKQRQCAALELSKEPICCAVSINHKLADKERLQVQDLFGENLMLIHRGWNSYVDLLRDDIWQHYPKINVIDFPFYDMNVFNQCERDNYVLMAIGNWEHVHPLLKILPVDWDYTIPFGLMHSPNPSDKVRTLLCTVAKVLGLENK